MDLIMKKSVQWLVLFVALAGLRSVPAATVSLFAGGGAKASGPATECRLADPFATEFDAAGQAFLCEMTNNRVLKIDALGVLTTIAGTTKKGSGGDGGPATQAEVNGAHNLVVDKNGDVYLADTWNWKIRRLDMKTGRISTFAGTGKKAFGGDGGPAELADFSGIHSLAFDAAHENLYLVDLDNRRVRVINLKTKVVRTVAGNGSKGVPADGSDAAASPLFDPRAVAVARTGDVYILERGGHALRVVDTKGKIRTVVGIGRPGPWTPTENPREATLKGPKHLCVDAQDNVLIADSENSVIRKYMPRENKLLLVAGTGRQGRGAAEGDPLKVALNHPHGVSVDGQGRIYISDSYNGRVLRIE
jgi:DNA-binding beta-propeller fold protein YncE